MRIELFISWFFSITTLTIMCSITIPVHSQCLEDQKSLLLQLKNSLQFDPDYSVKLVSWTQSHDCCQWNGVTCDHSGRVIGLDLNAESISGGLNHSSSLFSLKFLEKLNLANNSFNSMQIPSSFGVLTNLKYLNLSETDFVGQIPMELSRLTRLVKLDLSTSYFIPRIQIENPNLFTLFRNLSGLTELYLDGVNISANGYEWGQAISSALPNLRVLSLSSCFLSGPIDSSLQNLQFLSEINLNGNDLSVPIPDFFANFEKLTTLNLSDCNLNGTFPDIIFERVQTLETLDLSGNWLLNGHLPDFSQNLSLRNLVLSYTNFSEFLPESIGKLTELRRIEIPLCSFSGPIPNSLANLSQLVYLDLAGNNFSGPIPNSLANLSQLVYLQLSNNNFSGPIPSFQGSKKLTLINLYLNSLTGVVLSTHFEGLLDLSYIDLSYNSFNGSIPLSLFSLPSLQLIRLSNNKFSGPITGFSNESLSPLVSLDLSYNSFSGSIPSSLFSLPSLSEIWLSNNNFSGPIPSFQGSKKLTHIHLSSNSLTGVVLSTHFEGLLDLVHIDLSYNSFNGSIPSSLFSLPSLQEIWLSNNKFSGPITGFSNESLSPLVDLDLSSNKLEGPIPAHFFHFLGLNFLSLSFNNFSGNIDLEIFQRFQNLKSLDLSYNNLTVNPSVTNSSLSSFPQLDTLRLASCKLQKFPPLMNQSGLYDLDLSNNQISGVIPNWIWNISQGGFSYLNLSCNLLVGFQPEFHLHRLDSLDLHSNQLQGEIPLPPESASYLDYSRNNFSSIPVEIGKNIASAFFFSLSDNMLSGPIPPSICNVSSLVCLDLSNNRFSGTIPQCLIDSGSAILSVLDLRNNNLTGNITGTLAEDCKLRTLDLSGNNLEGEVPKSLANCADVEVLNLGTNHINSIFPCFLTNLSSLQVLILRSNKFHGNINCLGIYDNIWPKLQIIDLALNNFSSILPPQFFLQRRAMMDGGNAKSDLNVLHVGNYYQDSVTVINKGIEMKLVKILTIFTTIDFSDNNFKGEIPDTVGHLKSLHALNLSHNALTGSIPSALGNLTQLESLDLSWNKLGGSIPKTLASLTFLSVLNLSYNQLVGMIPRGSQLQTFSETSFKGNKGLCGAPLIASCGEAEPRRPTFDRRQEDEINWVYITATLGYIVGFGVIVGPLLYSKRWRQCYYKPVDRVILRILHHRERRARHQRRRDNKNQLRRHQHH